MKVSVVDHLINDNDCLSLRQSSSKALEQEIRERATVLQTEFENFVHSDPESVQAAKKGTLASVCLSVC